MIRNTLAAAATLLLIACTGANAPGALPTDAASTVRSTPGPVTTADTSPHVVPVESLADFAKRIHVECTPKGRELACIGGKPENGDIYDVELRPDCGADGFFGGVANDTGAEMRDALPPLDQSTPAVLGAGQLVCIQAIGSVGQDTSYFYVAAVPVADVPACKNNRLCVTYGDRITRSWAADGGKCHIESSGRPTEACPQGWVRREDIEDFSNGM